MGYDLTRGRDGAAVANPPPGASTAAPTARAASAASSGSGPAAEYPAGSGTAAAPTAAVLTEGTGTFQYAGQQGPVAGGAGALHQYRVAVEGGIGIAAGAFGSAVESILGDPRSWIAGGDLRLQRVPGDTPASFTVFLATPVTSQRMCREEWLETEQYTNCRLSDGRVVINLARWLTAVPDYGAPLATYQAYAVNHEVGHQLGHGHEVCPSPGRPAPVMQQQTLGLQGCVAYAWPYLGGVRYRGPPTSVG